MMKNVIKIGVVSVALATAALFAPASMAHPGNKAEYNHSHSNGKKAFKDQKRDYKSPGKYQARHFVPEHAYLTRKERRRAVRRCKSAIQYKTDQAFPGPYGFSEFVHRPDVWVNKRGDIMVKAPVRVSGKHDSLIAPSRCRIRYGEVTKLKFDAFGVRQQMRDNRRHQNYGSRNW